MRCLRIGYSLPLSVLLALPSNAGDPTRPDEWNASSGYEAIALAHRDVTLGAPFDGQLLFVSAIEGSTVERGTELARLDDREARAELVVAQLRAESMGDVVRARAEFEFAREERDRVTAAIQREAAKDRELHDAERRVRSADAALQSAMESMAIAQASMQASQVNVERHALRAPMDGVVVRRLLQPGSSVKMGDPIVRLVDTAVLEAEFHLPANLASTLVPGLSAMVRAGSPVRAPLGAVLKLVDPVIDPGTGTRRCVFVIANPGRRYPAGFTVSLESTDLEQVASAGSEQPEP